MVLVDGFDQAERDKLVSYVFAAFRPLISDDIKPDVAEVIGAQSLHITEKENADIEKAKEYCHFKGIYAPPLYLDAETQMYKRNDSFSLLLNRVLIALESPACGNIGASKNKTDFILDYELHIFRRETFTEDILEHFQTLDLVVNKNANPSLQHYIVLIVKHDTEDEALKKRLWNLPMVCVKNVLVILNIEGVLDESTTV